MADLTYEEMVASAEALVGENLQLRRELDEMRGRLREQRKVAEGYRRRCEAALEDKYDAQTQCARDRAQRRELVVAIVGAAVMLTCLLFVAAVVWGWHFC